MTMRMLLVCPEGETREAYTNAINKLGVQYDTVATFKELYYAMAAVPYNGILVDLNTKLRAPKEELSLVENILEKFPVIQLKWEGKAEKIRTYYFGQHKDGGDLGSFVDHHCRFFDSRKISIEKRITVHFSVILAKENDFREENIERTITINVSESGCFIFTNKKWDIRSDAWFIIKGISDQRPIRGEVRWCFEWGKNMQTPGIGVKFQEIKESQIHEICNAKQISETQRRRG